MPQLQNETTESLGDRLLREAVLLGFDGYAMRFRWLEGSPLLYVYVDEKAIYAEQAFPIESFLPWEAPTKDDAREAARAFLKERIARGAA